MNSGLEKQSPSNQLFIRRLGLDIDAQVEHQEASVHVGHVESELALESFLNIGELRALECPLLDGTPLFFGKILGTDHLLHAVLSGADGERKNLFGHRDHNRTPTYPGP